MNEAAKAGGILNQHPSNRVRNRGETKGKTEDWED
jgi:hypothetical protein